jgi:hypothetical protein
MALQMLASEPLLAAAGAADYKETYCSRGDSLLKVAAWSSDGVFLCLFDFKKRFAAAP